MTSQTPSDRVNDEYKKSREINLGWRENGYFRILGRG